MREEFDFGYVLVGVALVLSILYMTGVIGGSKAPKCEPVEENDRETPYTLE